MSDRLMILLGLVRLTHRPSPEPGDRYWVGAVVVNLTGKGSAERDLEWRGAGMRLLLQPREWNLAQESAARTLQQVKQGLAPQEALAWIPLMQGGSDPGILREWLRLAGRETDPQRRADLGLVLVFAELAGNQDLWREALKGWNMQEPQIVKEWQAETRADDLLRILQKRFKAVPEDLRTAILAVKDLDQLGNWIDLAVSVRTLRAFRKQANL
jgi:hypothetical protein